MSDGGGGYVDWVFFPTAGGGVIPIRADLYPHERESRLTLDSTAQAASRRLQGVLTSYFEKKTPHSHSWVRGSRLIIHIKESDPESIDGDSLGLAFALAAKAAFEGLLTLHDNKTSKASPPLVVVATGAFDARGHIGAVGHLREKLEAVLTFEATLAPEIRRVFALPPLAPDMRADLAALLEALREKKWELREAAHLEELKDFWTPGVGNKAVSSTGAIVTANPPPPAPHEEERGAPDETPKASSRHPRAFLVFSASIAIVGAGAALFWRPSPLFLELIPEVLIWTVRGEQKEKNSLLPRDGSFEVELPAGLPGRFYVWSLGADGSLKSAADLISQSDGAQPAILPCGHFQACSGKGRDLRFIPDETSSTTGHPNEIDLVILYYPCLSGEARPEDAMPELRSYLSACKEELGEKSPLPEAPQAQSRHNKGLYALLRGKDGRSFIRLDVKVKLEPRPVD